MLPVVIGSQALKYHSLLDREPADWDILIWGPKQFIKKQGFTLDLTSVTEPLEPTNRILYNYCQIHGHGPINTPIGQALVAPLEVLKILKIASAPLNKFKHLQDLKSLDGVIIPSELAELIPLRLMETSVKVHSQKDKFFNKYIIPRFIDHDELHLLINSNPMYLKVLKTDSSVEVDENKFNTLPLTDKRELVLEELMVLCLERKLIPQIRRCPHMVELFVDKFLETKKSTDPALYWLNRLAIVGKVKDHPDWLAAWIQVNYSFITAHLDSWWETKVDSLPVSFWQKLLKF